jgi:phage terminase large subunit-like protein
MGVARWSCRWPPLGEAGSTDRRGNLYPTKQRPEQKIDAAVALMMAVGRAMTVEEAPSIHESRGLLIF